MEKYVSYPPQGLLPLPGASTVTNPGCDVWAEIESAALLLNPGLNIYHILDTVSALFWLLFTTTVPDAFSQSVLSDVLFP
jgi:carboxypeptidase D